MENLFKIIVGCIGIFTFVFVISFLIFGSLFIFLKMFELFMYLI